MYQNVTIGVLGAASSITGIVALPNTGSNSVLEVLSIVSIAAGAAILLTTAARVAAKLIYKA